MPTPFVSVAVITYNQVDLISETIESALSRDYENLEVVVADDASTDGTTDIVLEYARRYPDRVVALTGSPNLGITGNCTRATRACRGELIAYLGGDDLFLPGKIRAQADWFLESPDRVLCSHRLDVFDSGTGQSLSASIMGDLFGGRGCESLVRKGCPFGASSVMVRACRVPSGGFDRRTPVASDYLFWLECVGLDGVFGYVDGCYGRYRRHAENVSGRKRLQILEDVLVALAIMEARHPSLADACKERRAAVLFDHGSYLLATDPTQARAYLAASIAECWHAKWRASPLLAATLLPAEGRDRVQRVVDTSLRSLLRRRSTERG